MFWAVKNDKVRRHQDSNVYKKPIKIYTKEYCGYCARAKELLREKGLMFEEVDVTHDDPMRQKLVELTGGRLTVPQIFIGSVYVGGYSDLAQWKFGRQVGPADQRAFTIGREARALAEKASAHGTARAESEAPGRGSEQAKTSSRNGAAPPPVPCQKSILVLDKD